MMRATVKFKIPSHVIEELNNTDRRQEKRDDVIRCIFITLAIIIVVIAHSFIHTYIHVFITSSIGTQHNTAQHINSLFIYCSERLRLVKKLSRNVFNVRTFRCPSEFFDIVCQ